MNPGQPRPGGKRLQSSKSTMSNIPTSSTTGTPARTTRQPLLSSSSSVRATPNRMGGPVLQSENPTSLRTQLGTPMKSRAGAAPSVLLSSTGNSSLMHSSSAIHTPNKTNMLLSSNPPSSAQKQQESQPPAPSSTPQKQPQESQPQLFAVSEPSNPRVSPSVVTVTSHGSVQSNEPLQHDAISHTSDHHSSTPSQPQQLQQQPPQQPSFLQHSIEKQSQSVPETSAIPQQHTADNANSQPPLDIIPSLTSQLHSSLDDSQQQPSTATLHSAAAPQQPSYLNNQPPSDLEDEDDDSYSDEDESDSDAADSDEEPSLRYQRLPLFRQITQATVSAAAGALEAISAASMPPANASETAAAAAAPVAAAVSSPPSPDQGTAAERANAAALVTTSPTNATLLTRGTLSATFCHEKFLLFGTTNGVVLQTDLQGNEVMKIRCHKSAITCLSADAIGDFIGSGSSDGSVVVTNLDNMEQTTLQLKSPVLSLSLSPQFKSQQYSLAAGLQDGRLILAMKGWLGYNEQVVHQGEGPVTAMAWNMESGLFAWAARKGVKILDITRGERISFISKPAHSFAPLNPIPQIIWARNDVIITAWGKTVKVCQLCYRDIDSLGEGHMTRAEDIRGHKTSVARVVAPGSGIDSQGKSNRYMRVIATFSVNDLITGLAVVNEHIALLLAHYELLDDGNADAAQNGTATVASASATAASRLKAPPGPRYRMFPPELRLVNYDGSTHCSEALVLHGFSHTNYENLRLIGLPGIDPLLYISNTEDVIAAALIELHEKILWFFTRNLFSRGISLCISNHIQPLQLQWYIECYLWSLIQSKQFSLCARECIRLLPPMDHLIDVQRIPGSEQFDDPGLGGGLVPSASSIGGNLDQLPPSSSSLLIASLTSANLSSSAAQKSKLNNAIVIWEWWLQVFAQVGALHHLVAHLGSILVLCDPQHELQCKANSAVIWEPVVLPTETKTTSSSSSKPSKPASLTNHRPAPTESSASSSKQKPTKNATGTTSAAHDAQLTIDRIITRYLQHIFPNTHPSAFTTIAQTPLHQTPPPNVPLAQTISRTNPNTHLLSTKLYSFAPNQLQPATALSSTFFTEPTTFPSAASHPVQTIGEQCYDSVTGNFRLTSLPITPHVWRFTSRRHHNLFSAFSSDNSTNGGASASSTTGTDQVSTSVLIHSHMLSSVMRSLLHEHADLAVLQLVQQHAHSFNTQMILREIYLRICQQSTDAAHATTTPPSSSAPSSSSSITNHQSGNDRIATNDPSLQLTLQLQASRLESQLENPTIALAVLCKLSNQIDKNILPQLYMQRATAFTLLPPGAIILFFSHLQGGSNNMTSDRMSLLNAGGSRNAFMNQQAAAAAAAAAAAQPQHQQQSQLLFTILYYIYQQLEDVNAGLSLCLLTGNVHCFDLIFSHDVQLLPIILPKLLDLALFFPFHALHFLGCCYEKQQRCIRLRNEIIERKKTESQSPLSSTTSHYISSAPQYSMTAPPTTVPLSSIPPLSYIEEQPLPQTVEELDTLIHLLPVDVVIEKLSLTPYLLYIYFTIIHRTDLHYAETSAQLSSQYSTLPSSMSNVGFMASSNSGSNLFSATHSRKTYNQPTFNTYVSKILPLYVQYAPNRDLITFLRTNSSYVLESAVTLCEERQRQLALVFLSYRTGNLRKAITLLLSPQTPSEMVAFDLSGRELQPGATLSPHEFKHYQLNNLQQAVAMVLESNDMALWDIVFTFSLRDSDCLTYLLESASMSLFDSAASHTDNTAVNAAAVAAASVTNSLTQSTNAIDVITLLKKIPHDCHIPNLHHVLHTILSNVYLHLVLTQTVYRTTRQDYRKHSLALKQSQQQGILISNEPVFGLRKLLQIKRQQHSLTQREKQPGSKHSSTTAINVASHNHHSTTTQQQQPKQSLSCCFYCNKACFLNLISIPQNSGLDVDTDIEHALSVTGGVPVSSISALENDQGALLYGCGHLVHKHCFHEMFTSNNSQNTTQSAHQRAPGNNSDNDSIRSIMLDGRLQDIFQVPCPYCFRLDLFYSR